MQIVTRGTNLQIDTIEEGNKIAQIPPQWVRNEKKYSTANSAPDIIHKEKVKFPNVTLCEIELHLVIVCFKSINL